MLQCIRDVVIIHPSIIVKVFFYKIPPVDVTETDINVSTVNYNQSF